MHRMIPFTLLLASLTGPALVASTAPPVDWKSVAPAPEPMRRDGLAAQVQSQAMEPGFVPLLPDYFDDGDALANDQHSAYVAPADTSIDVQARLAASRPHPKRSRGCRNCLSWLSRHKKQAAEPDVEPEAVEMGPMFRTYDLESHGAGTDALMTLTPEGQELDLKLLHRLIGMVAAKSPLDKYDRATAHKALDHLREHNAMRLMHDLGAQLYDHADQDLRSTERKKGEQRAIYAVSAWILATAFAALFKVTLDVSIVRSILVLFVFAFAGQSLRLQRWERTRENAEATKASMLPYIRPDAELLWTASREGGEQ